MRRKRDTFGRRKNMEKIKEKEEEEGGKTEREGK
jgi:hypothetical protein